MMVIVVSFLVFDLFLHACQTRMFLQSFFGTITEVHCQCTQALERFPYDLVSSSGRVED